MTKSAAHFVDCDIKTGTADTWTATTANSVTTPTPTAGKIQITTAAQLASIGIDPAYPRDGDYEVMNDISLSVYPDWTPICTFSVPFTGTFDGRGYVISDLTASNPAWPANGIMLGLFGSSISATFSNIYLENFDISNNVYETGGLIGRAQLSTTVTNCHIDGIILRGTNYGGGNYLGMAGGLFGIYEGDISRCSAINVSMIADHMDFTGGLCGRHDNGTISNCYAQGTADFLTAWKLNNGYEGGLIGNNIMIGTTFVNCYANMEVPPVPPYADGALGGFQGAKSGTTTYSSCYWNTTLGEDDGVGGTSASGLTGKTATELNLEATFVDWDFDDIWDIVEGVSPPTLRDVSGINPTTTTAGNTQNRTIAFPLDYSHLNGETVQVLGDGSYLGTETVVNGAIVLDDNTVVNHVGLKYTSKIQLMKINGEVNVKRISMIIPDFYETVGGDYGESETTLGTMVLRTSGDPIDTDGDLYSGHIELPFNGSYNRNGNIWVQQDLPFPMRLLGLGIRLSEEEI